MSYAAKRELHELYCCSNAGNAASFLQVMILDWDVHHGNGTNDLFYDDDTVLMVDMHEEGVWPGSGQLQESGTGQGQGHTINIPMPSELHSPVNPSSVLH